MTTNDHSTDQTARLDPHLTNEDPTDQTACGQAVPNDQPPTSEDPTVPLDQLDQDPPRKRRRPRPPNLSQEELDRRARVGTRLYNARMDSGIYQSELAVALTPPLPTNKEVSRWEYGERSIPQMYIQQLITLFPSLTEADFELDTDIRSMRPRRKRPRERISPHDTWVPPSHRDASF